MNINIGKYIYNAINGVVQGGLTVDPVVAVTDTADPQTPFAIYQRTSAQPSYTKNLWTGNITHSYSVTVVDNDYTNTVTLAQAIIDALLALSHTVQVDIRFGQVMLTDVIEDFQEGLYLQTLQFEINTTQL